MHLHIEQEAFMGWREAYRLQSGDVAMVIVTEIGPRILSLTVGDGPNLLFVDSEKAGRGQGDAQWNIYGGHRLWVAPETGDTADPDNAPCQVHVADDRFTVIAPVSPRTQLQKRLTIRASENGFQIEQGILNTGDALYPGAAWSLTCVVPQGVIVFPWGQGGKWDPKKIIYWRQWLSSQTDVTSPQWQPGPDLFRVVLTGETGKVGTNTPEGWIALCRQDATFIKWHPWIPGAQYPDDNCSLEIYTCSRFAEMETLGPMGIFYPGQEVVHREVWTVLSRAIAPTDAAALRAAVRRARP